MDANNYAGLDREAVLAAFEQERKDWLKLGMSEEVINRIHFGEEEDKGRGGDYRMWLSERKHRRADHKYAPGAPVSIDAVDPHNAWISGGSGGLDEAETRMDLARALDTLTELQRRSFTEVHINGLTQSEAAVVIGVSRESVKQAISGAIRKLKKSF